MQTRLAAAFRDSAEGRAADAILRACVHCGFCNATCPTYRLLGDELDGPRGRIYQIKQLLEGARATALTQLHLDRCLTCRNCETTCPSGVEYGRLLEIGRSVVHAQVRRPLPTRLLHALLRAGLTRRWLFGGAVRLGRALGPLLPGRLRAPLGQDRPAGSWPRSAHPRRVLLLEGCVQGALVPAIDAATARVLDALGVGTLREPRAGCCGAIRAHLDDLPGARREARRNVDAWSRHFEPGAVEALVVNASACAATVKDYARLLADDPAYAQRAHSIAARTFELGAFLAPEAGRLAARVRAGAAPRRVAFHRPCTLQHALRAGDETARLLEALGAQLTPVAEPQMCCGAAGTYSLLQGELARRLRARKLGHLEAGSPETILSANIGCLTHLAGATATPVRHWIEWVDRAIGAGA
jgi:glycolate oxidase iron-sulfur subunit